MSLQKTKRKKISKSSEDGVPSKKVSEGALSTALKHQKPHKSVRVKEEQLEWTDFDMDERLLKAIAEMGWERPTRVQCAMIPLVLDDKNVLARARTGCGKTAAFLLPVVQKVIQLAGSAESRGPFALIIAPTKELASQIHELAQHLIAPFPFVQLINFGQYASAFTPGQDVVDIIVTTPGKLISVLRQDFSDKGADKLQKEYFLANVRHVVLDEADLLFSYGYGDEIRIIKAALPHSYQTLMTSATLSEDMTELKRMFVVGQTYSLQLKEGDLPDADQLSQYQLFCLNDEERFTIFLAMLKLKLLVGKSVIFVSSTTRCYQLHLFLQTFKIPSCVLNAQLPVNSRLRAIHEFNQGQWDYLIASECNDLFDENAEEEDKQEPDSSLPSSSNSTKKSAAARDLKKSGRKHNSKVDKESGIGRGIDFHHVSNVVNFDFPTSPDMYIHRVGRTARGFNKGTAISFVDSQRERECFEKVSETVAKRMGRSVMQPYEIRIEEFDGFRLRTRDVLAACTKTVIRETRLAEIRAELLRSKQLDAYFARNPREKRAIEQDRRQFKMNIHSAGIADVPDYIVPKALRNSMQQQGNGDSSGHFRSDGGGKARKDGKKNKRWRPFEAFGAQKKHMKRMADPLRSFKAGKKKPKRS